jgi:hypothetical protein
LPVWSTIFGSAPPASNCSAILSLPLNAAAAKGVTPERPARLGSARFSNSSATIRGRSVSAAY